MTDFSVLIVNWNGRGYLEKCLRSVYGSMGEAEFQCVVVDNASTDGSVAMVRELFPQVELVESGSNLGFARGNNLGFDYCQGRYIFLVNSDIEMHAGGFAELCAYMDAHPKAGMVGPKVLNPDLTLQDNCLILPTPWNIVLRALALDRLLAKFGIASGEFAPESAYDREHEVDALVGCFLGVRREALDQVGPLDPDFFMYGEDLDWCKRFRQAGWSIRLYPQVAVIHYGGGSSDNAPVPFYLELKRSSLRYWAKHYGSAGMIWCRLVTMLHEAVRVLFGVAGMIARPSQRDIFQSKARRSIACLGRLLNPGWGLQSPKEQAKEQLGHGE